jgi:hypothetical protein
MAPEKEKPAEVSLGGLKCGMDYLWAALDSVFSTVNPIQLGALTAAVILAAMYGDRGSK